MRYLLCVSIFGLALPSLRAADFDFADGDRVILIGNTLIEREQRYAYWEIALTRRYPQRNVTFRNLGWSGDTVFGAARAGFGGPADGYRRLKEHVLALKPTVLIVAYGLNESFQGAAGLPRFTEGLNKLLDDLAGTKVRVILLAPPRQEDLGRPLPDPTVNNRNLQLYRDALRQIATKRGLTFVDLFDRLAEAGKAGPLTDNGIHLTAYGYWRSAAAIEQGLGGKASRWRVEIDKDGKPTMIDGVHLTDVHTEPLRFTATDAVLPPPVPPKEAPAKAALLGVERLLRVQGLTDGKYTLRIDGQVVTAATAAEWAVGVTLHAGPEFEQAERLRATLIEKNQLYFHRWRPQNETYLFGFRKNEQGQNAREVPQFDPLVAKQEAIIAKLRVPTAHQYELTAERTR